MFSLRQVKTFVTVAENKSFTIAAKLLYMTQPAVSAQIKVLEERLEVRLMERNDKNITLTEAGELFYEESKKILSIYDGFIESISELKGVRRGKLFLAASTIPGEYIIPKILGGFGRLYPGLEISLKISDTGMVVDQLVKKSVDIGIIGAVVKNEGLRLQELMRDELILISSFNSNHKCEEITIEELIKTNLVLRESESGTRMVFHNKLKEFGIDTKKLRVIMELGSTRAIITAVESGMGIGVASKLAAQDAITMGKISEVKVKGLDFHRWLYLAWNENSYLSYAAKAFLSYIETKGEKLKSANWSKQL